MATPGTFISGIGHVGLMVWLIAGWGFDAEPLQIQTMDVSVISGEEFEQMRARTTPNPAAADPQTPVPPVVDETPPPPPAAEEPAQPAPQPQPVEPPASETPPPPAPPPPPVEAEVVDVLPPAPVVPDAPPPTPELEVSEAPTPPQAPTVASELTQPPPPDARIDDVAREEVTPSEAAEPQIVAEEQQATAPEQTTTAIVIEDLAPSTSVRPATRPRRPAPTQAVAATPEAPTPPAPAPDTTEDEVAAALADALAAAAPQTPPAPAVTAGPPLTGGERDSFRLSVNRCWNVDPGSVAARVTVEVGFNLDRDGRVIGNEVRLLSSDGDQSATNTAFEAARRAVLRCQSGGYQLPADKYDQWQEVVITFDPSGMRLR